MDPNIGAWIEDGDTRWLRTGDKGWLDKDGYLFISGRFKELINRGGEKLSPFVVEQALLDHPGVGHIMAFAAPHRELGEVVGLMATSPPPSAEPATVKALRGYGLRGGALPAKWLPEALVWVDALPKGPTGKPARIGIAEKLQLPEFRSGGDHQYGAWKAEFEEAAWHLTWLQDIEVVSSASTSDAKNDCVSTVEIVKRAAMEAANLPDCSTWNEDTVLLDAGLDSFSMITMLALLSHTAGVDLPSEVVVDCLTLGAVATFIDDQKRQKEPRKRKKKVVAKREFEGDTWWIEDAGDPDSGLFSAKEGRLGELKERVDRDGWQVSRTFDKHGLTALQWAAGGGHQQTVAWLLQHNEVNQVNKEGRSAFMWACRNGHLGVAKQLVEAGADTHMVTKKGVNALHWAIWGQRIQVAEWLLTLGLDLESRTNAGCNCAVWGAASGDIAMCRWLLQVGADFTQINWWGHGVINKAGFRGHIELLRFFFSEEFKGQDLAEQLFLEDARGFTPAQLSESNGKHEAAAFLRAKMAEHPDRIVREAVTDRGPVSLQLLDPDAGGERGM